MWYACCVLYSCSSGMFHSGRRSDERRSFPRVEHRAYNWSCFRLCGFPGQACVVWDQCPGK